LMVLVEESGVGAFGNGNRIHGSLIWRMRTRIASLPPPRSDANTGR
jgi:hypothetical protein